MKSLLKKGVILLSLILSMSTASVFAADQTVNGEADFEHSNNASEESKVVSSDFPEETTDAIYEKAETETATLETYYFEQPLATVEEEPEETDKLLFSADDIKNMTEEEFFAALKAELPLEDADIEQIVSYYKDKSIIK